MQNDKQSELAIEKLEELSGGRRAERYERSEIQVQSIQDAGQFDQLGQGGVKPLRAR